MGFAIPDEVYGVLDKVLGHGTPDLTCSGLGGWEHRMRRQLIRAATEATRVAGNGATNLNSGPSMKAVYLRV